MNRSHFLSMAVIAILMVTLVSCATVGETYEDYGRDSYGRRVRVVEPVYGTGDVLLVRDPYTGRYYQVNSYGNGLYDPFWDSRYYNSRYNKRYYRGGYSGGGRGPATGQPESKPRGNSQKINEARERVKGN